MESGADGSMKESTIPPDLTDTMPARGRTTAASRPDTNQRADNGSRARISARAYLWLASLTMLAFIVMPLLAIFVRAWSEDAFGDRLGDPVVYDALLLSFVTTGLSLLVAVTLGMPVAFLLARYRFRGRDLLDTLVDLPMVLPPAVAGVALLMAFGRQGVLGPFLSDTFGIELPFTTAAVVIAQTFVAMPFFVRAAKAGFESVPRELEEAASLEGSRPRVFAAITIPLAFPALLGGAVMTWARALGEFGATIMFAGNFQGRTQTMPLAIYGSLESGRLDAALVLSGILIVVSFTVLVIFRLLARAAIGDEPLRG